MNYDDIRTSIDHKQEQRAKLLSELDQSMALQSLIPNIFDYSDIRSQWSDESISQYAMQKLKPNSRALAKFRVYSGSKLMATFNYSKVPEALHIFKVQNNGH